MPATMPRFGLAAGVASLALAAVAAGVWWAPIYSGHRIPGAGLPGRIGGLCPWRLAALTVFFTVVTYLTFGPSMFTNSPSFLFYFIQQFFGPLVGGASLTAYLIWSYRQSRRGA